MKIVTGIIGTKNEVLPNYEFFEVVAKLFCQIGIVRELFCSPTIYFLFGPEATEMFNVVS